MNNPITFWSVEGYFVFPSKNAMSTVREPEDSVFFGLTPDGQMLSGGGYLDLKG